jgi:hypothetical protein
VRGYEPLLFDTLPEMPFWKDFALFRAELVENVGSNPLRSTEEMVMDAEVHSEDEGNGDA